MKQIFLKLDVVIIKYVFSLNNFFVKAQKINYENHTKFI